MNPSAAQESPAREQGGAVPLLAVSDLVVEFPQPGRRAAPMRAVDRVSFTVGAGETVGLVGESGSGKSTIGRAILGLVPVAEGAIVLDGDDITGLDHGARRRLATDLQVVFQDPFGSFDPRQRIGSALAEPLIVQGRRTRAEVRSEVEAMLERVGMPPSAVERYPSEFSGGQRQRLAIARALSVRPRLAVCDEPISSLDLSTQAQVLNLLRELRLDLGLAFLFIAHHLVAVRHLSDRVVVLYRGRIMESGPVADVCDTPWHPYSVALWAASPVPDPVAQRERRAARRAGAVSEVLATRRAPGADACPFAHRCPYVADVCWERRPADVAVGARTLACHLFDPDAGHPDEPPPAFPPSTPITTRQEER